MNMKKLGMILLGIAFLGLLLYLFSLVGLLKMETRAAFEEQERQRQELLDGIVFPPGPNLVPNRSYDMPPPPLEPPEVPPPVN